MFWSGLLGGVTMDQVILLYELTSALTVPLAGTMLNVTPNSAVPSFCMPEWTL